MLLRGNLRPALVIALVGSSLLPFRSYIKLRPCRVELAKVVPGVPGMVRPVLGYMRASPVWPLWRAPAPLLALVLVHAIVHTTTTTTSNKWLQTDSLGMKHGRGAILMR